MRKKVIAVIISLSVLCGILRTIYINIKFPGYDYIEKNISESITINDIEIDIEDYSFLSAEEYCSKYPKAEKNSDALIYVVLNMRFTNPTDKDKDIDLTQMRLLQGKWYEYFYLNDLYSINSIESYLVKVLPGHSGTLTIPFLYLKKFENDFDHVRGKGFTLYLKNYYPKWNEVFTINLNYNDI
ncbi:hypothetical protein [Ruminococcus sp. HUN007]|uniref:hypothetical protein n=1 Tax=Ruminococcus sp. HUN007 TaxID=1514668 RepID=UPI0005D1E2DA|nr:hypothetical protein [Ruminococcus sp. HUN007]